MKFQFVLQFDESALSFDDIVTLEGRLEKNLHGFAEVDGHDIGSGEINIFLYTDFPEKLFKKIESEIIDEVIKNELRAAYRGIEEDTYTILWPNNLDTFDIL
jgi:hypothetical protein